MPSRTSILETIPKIVAVPPKISSKSTTGAFGRVFFGVQNSLSHHPFVSLGLLIGISIGTWMWRKGRIRFGRGGFFHLDGKEGLLNGGGYGKAD